MVLVAIDNFDEADDVGMVSTLPNSLLVPSKQIITRITLIENCGKVKDDR
jgi:hypothetical protein